MTFLADDDETFEAVLSFIDDFTADDPLPEVAVAANAIDSEQLHLDDLKTFLIDDTQLQVDATVVTRASDNNCGIADEDPVIIETLYFSHQTSNKVKKKRMRKDDVYRDSDRVRDEHQHEIAYLREEVGRLETKVRSIRQRFDARPIEFVTRSREIQSAAFSEEQISSAVNTLKDFAARERKERELAECENVRLKRTLVSQIEAAKELENILRRRAQLQIAECSALIQKRVDVGYPSDHKLDFRADAADFQGLLQYLDDAYSQVNAVLGANGLAWKESTQHDVQMRKGVNGMYLEVFSNKVMPFGLRVTAEATWNYFKGSKKHRGTPYAKEVQNLDTPYTIIEYFSKELVAGNSSTDVCIKQVVRRYVEADREVVVWVASIVPVDITQKPFGGFASRHRSYAVIKRAKASTPQHQLSLLQLVSHGMLDMQTGAMYDPKYVRAVTDFLLNDAARNIKADQQLIENVLMDQMLRP